jgi:hypothetical protein
MAAITSDLTVGWSNLDTGSEAASTWYYLYLVKPSTNGGAPTAKISATVPSTTTGRAKYHPSHSDWRFVGTFYNNSSSDISRFEVRDDTVYLDKGYNLVGGGTATSYTSLSLSSYVPNIAVAKEVLISMFIHSGNVAEADRRGYISSDSSGNQVIYVRHRTYPTADRHQSGGNTFCMPLNSNQQIWYKMDANSMYGYIDVFGYVEEY